MSLSTASDEDLMARIREHSEEALQELMARYCARLGDFAFTLLRRRDLAEEAVSNVLVNIWRRRETLVVKTNVRSYLFAAVNNQALNLRKARLSQTNVGLDDVPAHELADVRRLDTDILYRELQEELDALIARMPPQRQLVFRMNRLEGLRYWEIAAMLGLAESTVQNHMVQAVKQMAQELPRLRSSLTRSPLPDTVN